MAMRRCVDEGRHAAPAQPLHSDLESLYAAWVSRRPLERETDAPPGSRIRMLAGADRCIRAGSGSGPRRVGMTLVYEAGQPRSALAAMSACHYGSRTGMLRSR